MANPRTLMCDGRKLEIIFRNKNFDPKLISIKAGYESRRRFIDDR